MIQELGFTTSSFEATYSKCFLVQLHFSRGRLMQVRRQKNFIIRTYVSMARQHRKISGARSVPSTQQTACCRGSCCSTSPALNQLVSSPVELPTTCLTHLLSHAGHWL